MECINYFRRVLKIAHMKRTIEPGYLNNDQKLFLEQKVDLTKHLEESDAFRRKVEIFLAEKAFYAEAEKNHREEVNWEKEKLVYEEHCKQTFFIDFDGEAQ